MTKLFLDTSIVIDLLAERAPYHQSAAKLFSLSDQKKVELVISALTFANTHYILSRQTNTVKAREILSKFKVLVKVAALDDKIIELALSDKSFNDFEDGLQYYTALEQGCSSIITRNLKDFKTADLPVMTAESYQL